MKLFFCFHTYEISFSIIDVILLINLIFLSSKLNVPTLNTKCSFLHALDFKEMARIVTKQQNGLNFGRRKTLWKSTLIFNYRIESLMDTLNFQIVCYYLITLMNDPSSLILQSRDPNLI